MPDLVVNHWPDWFRARYGGGWPDTYLSWDVETTGLSPAEDLVVEWGHVIVEGGRVVDRFSAVIDWTADPRVDQLWLDARVARVNRDMAARGAPCHTSLRRMRAEGMAPREALAFVRQLLTTWAGRDRLFVGHNLTFDERMVDHNLRRLGDAPAGFRLGDDRFLDTAAVEKASQCFRSHPAALPRAGDTLRSYFARVQGLRLAGLLSNLNGHVAAKYGLVAKYALDQAQAHTAGHDAYLVHLLMEEFRRGLQPAAEPALVGPSAPAAQPPAAPAPAAPVAGSRPGPPAADRVRGQRNN